MGRIGFALCASTLLALTFLIVRASACAGGVVTAHSSCNLRSILTCIATPRLTRLEARPMFACIPHAGGGHG